MLPADPLQIGKSTANRSILTSIAQMKTGILDSKPSAEMALHRSEICQTLKTSILIVEDEESVRTFLAQVLSHLGHRVWSASDGLDGTDRDA